MSDSLKEGLVKFYSSQAETILSQYENINQLLGPTNDWTAPGTLCENLIRDFLRRHMLEEFGVDKGFVYGRVNRNGREYHGPEIDILIHDRHAFKPIYRLDDFVIVKPEAVRGIIQVKRAFRQDPGGNRSSALAKGIQQCVDANQHLLDVKQHSRIESEQVMYKNEQWRVRKYPDLQELRGMPVFSAVVSFEDDIDMEMYRTHLQSTYEDNRLLKYDGCEYDTSLLMLPDFVGSLKHIACVADKSGVESTDFFPFESTHESINVGLQLFLHKLVDALFWGPSGRPPFAYPTSFASAGHFSVPTREAPTAPEIAR